VRTAAVIVAALVAGVAALTLYLFVFVPSDHVTRADAIVVLSGDRKRVATALRLFHEHVAPTLVISRDYRDWPVIDAVCREPHVMCLHVSPYSTRGEAETTGRLERTHHWRRVVVVTSRYHLRRARMLFDRCGVRPQVVAARTTLRDFVIDIPWEWGKLLYQLAINRSC
jgi:hypothetical protein